MATTVTNMFSNLRQPIDYTTSTLMRGVTDFGNLKQYNLFETGYSFLVCVGVPVFLEKLAKQDSNVQMMLNNYIHIIENEFRGLSGLDNITSENLELTNGISNINVISKVIQQSASQLSLRYFEKAGSPLTRLHRYFLTGIKDPMTQVKTYHGLINNKDANLRMEAGYENEVFTFLYFVTDNTVTKVEQAYLLLNAQPTNAEMNMYESEKGTIESKEITVEYNCFPVTSSAIDAKAIKYLDYMLDTENTPASKQFIAQSENFSYTMQKNTTNLPKGF